MDGHTHTHTHTLKPTVAFHSFVNMPKHQSPTQLEEREAKKDKNNCCTLKLH